MATSVMVVESPAKAKTINKYLGSDYYVIASYGHIRDLPPKDGSVDPDNNYAMSWIMSDRGKQQIKEISRHLKTAKRLILATDPDREGEAISWHVYHALRDSGALKGKDVCRVTFNEITKESVQQAIKAPRELDQSLIDAYLARRALDYLYGFTLSPVLWRKLPGSKSAGRVQSAALRLICERESEIEDFDPQEYWSIEGDFQTKASHIFTAKLSQLAGEKLSQFSLKDKADAQRALSIVKDKTYHVYSLETKQVRRRPAPPFTTSTLQQEASRKLGMSAQVTMKTAQQLYEGIALRGETVGLITYMRTDGVSMAPEALASIRGHIRSHHGTEYLPEKPNVYSVKAKNAQEAHEAIRPTDVHKTPKDVAGVLSREQLKLYTLIWKRAVASQMAHAVLDQTTVIVASEDKQTHFKATGSVVVFPGYMALYLEGKDDSSKEDDNQNPVLPKMAVEDVLKLLELRDLQHYTQPPPRYSEASLVKKMEEIGIGRPSTYASVLGVLRDREYVRLESRRFIPEDRGRIVTAFLLTYFNRYVDTGFTAQLETQLDEISGGRADWHTVMSDFWRDFYDAVKQTKDLKISDVIDVLDADLGSHFFPPKEDGSDPRACPKCQTGRVGLKLSKTGAFLGCDHYPGCKYTRPLAANDDRPEEKVIILGDDPSTGLQVTIQKGPYGHYLQLGDSDPDLKDVRPKRAPIPSGKKPEQITLQEALSLLSLPRHVGLYPETQDMITAGLGRFGAFVRVGTIYATIGKDDDVYTIGVERAVELLDKKKSSMRSLGNHPKDKQPVLVRKGKFGAYVQHKKTIASLPKETSVDDITLEDAIALLKASGKPMTGGKQHKAKRGRGR